METASAQHATPASAGAATGASRLRRWLRPFARAEAHEVPALLWSFAFFFCLLACNYLLKPIRDAFGILGGTRNIPWLYTGTFVAMLVLAPLYAFLAARVRRRVFVRTVFLFFGANLLAFWILFQVLPVSAQVQASRVFYIWHAVFNLFIVSVFWSSLAEVFSSDQGKRLFGFVAAGGTLGGLFGSALAGLAVARIGTTHLMLVPIAFLLGAIGCAQRLSAFAVRAGDTRAAAPLGGGALDGLRAVFRSPYLLGISAYLLFLTLSNTFLYQVQNHIYDTASSDTDVHTGWFASVNTWQQGGTLLVQALLAARLIRWLGIGLTLAIPCVLSMAGFGVLGVAPTLAAVTLAVAVLGASRYAVYTPAREPLFTVVPREDKYKAKGFIDTAVYRGGDVTNAWLYRLLGDAGLSLAAICFLTLPVGLAWIATGLFLGREQRRLAAAAARR
ncbi:MAG: MFS transporter [Planctomycetota bacterium]|nr:MAG: MFS transporter [Planctomycetota bacterium]